MLRHQVDFCAEQTAIQPEPQDGLSESTRTWTLIATFERSNIAQVYTKALRKSEDTSRREPAGVQIESPPVQPLSQML